jgi:hypothetical protein
VKSEEPWWGALVGGEKVGCEDGGMGDAPASAVADRSAAHAARSGVTLIMLLSKL